MDLDNYIEGLIGKGCGISAMLTAEKENMRKMKGERDTEFVKRIATTYNRMVLAPLFKSTKEQQK